MQFSFNSSGIRNVLCALLITSVIQAKSQETRNTTIHVGPALAHQHYEHFKQLVLESDDSHAEFIDGFEFEWGFNYTLLVKETKLAYPLSDGTQYNYELQKVLEKTRVADTVRFLMYTDPQRYYAAEDDPALNTTFSQADDSTYLYMDEVFIEVPEDLREAFAGLTAGTTGWRGKYAFIGARRIRLVALL